MGKFKILDIPRKEIEVGDILIGNDQTEPYMVLEVGTTFFHNHNFMKVIFSNGSESKFMITDLDERRTVARVVS